MSKAIIGTESLQTMFKRAHEVARKIDGGELLPEADYHLNFESAARLFSELTPRRMELLEELKRSGPRSIYALAKGLHRNYSNVHSDVRILVDHGLLEK
ncbi:MAG: hypothetical protein Q8J61_01395, partial [Sulfuricella sp.]|nr:hypothetical protein [Sulfuricella sp.]